MTSHCGRLIDFDRTAPASVAWRCCCLKSVPEMSQRFLALLSPLRPWVPGSSGDGQRNVLEMSRLLQNARHDLCKNRSFAEDDGGDCYIVANSTFSWKAALSDRSLNVPSVRCCLAWNWDQLSKETKSLLFFLNFIIFAVACWRS